MLFKFKKKDKNLEEEINFIKKQRKINRENIEEFKRIGFATKDLEEWDSMYTNILKLLKSERYK